MSDVPYIGCPADCRKCGKSIRWAGKYWEHVDSAPRHPGSPKQTTFPDPPSPTLETARNAPRDTTDGPADADAAEDHTEPDPDLQAS